MNFKFHIHHLDDDHREFVKLRKQVILPIIKELNSDAEEDNLNEYINYTYSETLEDAKIFLNENKPDIYIIDLNLKETRIRGINSFNPVFDLCNDILAKRHEGAWLIIYSAHTYSNNEKFNENAYELVDQIRNKGIERYEHSPKDARDLRNKILPNILRLLAQYYLKDEFSDELWFNFFKKISKIELEKKNNSTYTLSKDYFLSPINFLLGYSRNIFIDNYDLKRTSKELFEKTNRNADWDLINEKPTERFNNLKLIGGFLKGSSIDIKYKVTDSLFQYWNDKNYFEIRNEINNIVENAYGHLLDVIDLGESFNENYFGRYIANSTLHRKLILRRFVIYYFNGKKWAGFKELEEHKRAFYDAFEKNSKEPQYARFFNSDLGFSNEALIAINKISHSSWDTRFFLWEEIVWALEL